MPLSTVYLGEKMSALYVRMGQSRPVAMPWHRKGRMPAPAEKRRLTKENLAWARDSLCLKWCVGERAGVNQ